ncbi:MAG: HlyD family efflux transporter periplasmic adaptor subunit [Pseudomonadota bacterium]|nr:HlyD family efflux transporter periplasmic adaptor subunit [Pseudomonadota bacterium]
MRFLRQSLTGLFLMAVTIGLLFYAVTLVRGAVEDSLGQDNRRGQGRERVFAVSVLTAEPQTVSPTLQAYGQIESRRSLVLRAAVSGPVVELADNMTEGGVVSAGQMLLRIDPVDAQAALDRAQADLQDSEAETRDAERALELAEADLTAAQEQAALRQKAFERQQGLQARGVVTDTAVETAELAAASARQSVVTRRQSLAQAEARVDKAATGLARATIARDEAQRNLDDTVLRAEFDGTLSDVSVVAGGLVSTNEQLAQLVDGQTLEVAFRVSTAQYARLLDDAGRLRPAPVEVSLDVSGIDLSTKGQLSRDSAAVAEGQSGRLIFATLDSPRGMKPGDFVTVAVEEPPLDRVVQLPSKALGSDGRVLVIGEGDRLEAVEVTLLRRQGDDVLVRARGLAGRQVVKERTPLLGAGIKVRPLNPAGADAAPAEPQTVALTAERRAKLVAFVEANKRMPADAKERILNALKEEQVPTQMVQRLEDRMGS